MAKVTVNRTVNAASEKVWVSWDNFGEIYKFNPNLEHSHLIQSSQN